MDFTVSLLRELEKLLPDVVVAAAFTIFFFRQGKSLSHSFWYHHFYRSWKFFMKFNFPSRSTMAEERTKNGIFNGNNELNLVLHTIHITETSFCIVSVIDTSNRVMFFLWPSPTPSEPPFVKRKKKCILGLLIAIHTHSHTIYNVLQHCHDSSLSIEWICRFHSLLFLKSHIITRPCFFLLSRLTDWYWRLCTYKHARI